MNSILTIDIKGDVEFRDVVRSLDVESTVDAALRWGAGQIETRAKRLVRVDTGSLRASIEGVRVGRLQYVIGSSKAYAASQEFGRPDLHGYHFRPYLRPAAEAVAPLIEQRIQTKLGERS